MTLKRFRTLQNFSIITCMFSATKNEASGRDSAMARSFKHISQLRIYAAYSAPMAATTLAAKLGAIHSTSRYIRSKSCDFNSLRCILDIT
ncbi:hypothetical protein [Sinorhizobium sp. A49]|uniref:hypothetical protein n=1 Tax=Sinorhizobium sp. A49 TaxID=1945861 RepID=UPI0011155440|nr:hypothetical protein [Sinorhizobium sp. A49]